MNGLKSYIPSTPSMVREVVIVLVGVLGAAFILSRFPKLQAFVRQSSITVDDNSGNSLF